MAYIQKICGRHLGRIQDHGESESGTNIRESKGQNCGYGMEEKEQTISTVQKEKLEKEKLRRSKTSAK